MKTKDLTDGTAIQMKTPTRHLVLGKYLVLKIVKKKVILPTLGLDEFDIGPAMIGC